MKRRLRFLFALLLVPLAGCGAAAPGAADLGSDPITQISVINALMIGRYDGVATISELLRHGDFGVGTLDHLDGELIVLDGTAYQVGGNGVVAVVGVGRSTPFATVVRFHADGELPCPVVASLSELDARLSEALPQKNEFAAIRVDARLASITLRSVHRQEPPYKPLGEVARSQSVWTHDKLEGTLLGIRCPAWVGGLNVPGCHWHFLSKDHTIGGHVLDCSIEKGRVQYDLRRDWLIKLENAPDYHKADLGQDLSRELKRVESARGGENEANDREPQSTTPR